MVWYGTYLLARYGSSTTTTGGTTIPPCVTLIESYYVVCTVTLSEHYLFQTRAEEL